MIRSRLFVSAFLISSCALAVACSSGGDDSGVDEGGSLGGSSAGGEGGTSSIGGTTGGTISSGGHAAGATAGAAGHAGGPSAGSGGSPATAGGHAGVGGEAAGNSDGGASAGKGGVGGESAGHAGEAGSTGTAGKAGEAGNGGEAGVAGAAGKGGSAGASTGGSAGKGGASAGAAGQSGTAGSTTGGTTGAAGNGNFTPPVTCDDANGYPGCCSPDLTTNYYWDTKTTHTLKTKVCAAGKACGWSAQYSSYECVATAMGGTTDPSGQNPIACFTAGAGDATCTAGTGGNGGASGAAGNAGASGNATAGNAGAAGANAGAAGAAGASGNAGAAGDTGTAGTSGAAGASGSAGNAGAAGGVGFVLAVEAVDPDDGASNVSTTSPVSITFNADMDLATLTTQAIAGACSGSVQVSCDDFATCEGLSAVTLDATGKIATVQPTLPFANSATCAVRVTTAAGDTTADVLPVQYDMASGFTIAAAGQTGCSTGPAVVISRIYPGGGNASATYNQKFVELFNRSGATVDVSKWSLQYASQALTSAYAAIPLAGSIAPGGHLLVGLFVGATGLPLPVTPEVTSSTNPSGTSGKLALVTNATAIAAGCPAIGGAVEDFVAYGKTNGCSPVTLNTSGTASNANNGNELDRRLNGCGVSTPDDVSMDFVVALATAPENHTSAATPCAVCKLVEAMEPRGFEDVTIEPRGRRRNCRIF